MTDQTTKKSNSLSYIIIAVLIISGFLFFKYCTPSKQSLAEQTNLVAALQDSIRYYKDKDSSNIATIEGITTESLKYFLMLKVRNEEVEHLQEIVRGYGTKLKAGSSATAVTIGTHIKNRLKTELGNEPDETWMFDDTAYVNGILHQYYLGGNDTSNLNSLLTPIYDSRDSTEWIDLSIRASVDTTTYDLKIKNKFDVVVGQDNGKVFADIKSYNPYSEVQQFRTYQVSIPKQKPKRWGIGIQGGGTYIIDKFRPYIGAGLSYNFITF